MKKDFIKKVAVMSMAACMMFSTISFAETKNYGSDLKMTNVYIEGNRYTSAVKGYKKSSNKTISLLVNKMFKDDGDSSDYRYSWWQVVNMSNGSMLNSGVKVTKGTLCKLTLNARTSTSSKVSINVKGNVSDLDALVCGYIYDFNK